MKLYFLLFIFVSLNFFSQRQVGAFNRSILKADNLSPALTFNNLCDTASHVAFGFDSTYLFLNAGTGNWGYVSGTNSYKDISKAEKFFATDFTPGYQLAGGIFHLARAVDGSTPTFMKMTGWKNDGPAFYPKSTLSSVSVPIASFGSDSTLTTILFTNPAPVNGDFYLGLEGFSFSNPQDDTIAIYTSSGSVLINTAYEQWVDSSWHAFSEPNNWNFKAHFFIAAILCNTDVGIYQVLNSSDNIMLFPNPGFDNVTLSTGEGFNEKTRIKVFDVFGKLIYEDEFFSVNGNYQLCVSGYQSGVYQIIVTCNQRVRRTKMVIQ